MSLAGMTDRGEVHRRVCSLKGQRGELDYEQGRWLLAAYRLRVHESLGLGSFAEYAERFGGIDARQARERVRVAEALESLPELAAALKRGQLNWSAVRELTRVVAVLAPAVMALPSAALTSGAAARAWEGRTARPPAPGADPALVQPSGNSREVLVLGRAVLAPLVRFSRTAPPPSVQCSPAVVSARPPSSVLALRACSARPPSSVWTEPSAARSTETSSATATESAP